MKLAPAVKLALYWLRRDAKSGELRLLTIALVIAVTSVTTVDFFTDRVRKGLAQQAGELIAADLVLSMRDPISIDRQVRAQKIGLKTAKTLGFRSVVVARDQTQLIEVKAVNPAYPLRGRLRVADKPFDPEYTTTEIPSTGTAWVDTRLLTLLQLNVGDMLNVGHAQLRIAQILTYEPDRPGDLFNIAPRLLMSLDDIAATRLLAAGSRAEYRFLVAGEPNSVQRYRDWLATELKPGERLIGAEEGRTEMRTALERGRQFLGLAALVSVILAGVAIATSATRFVERRLDATALMRCFGATQKTIIKLFALEVAALGILASALGCLLGFIAQEGLARLLGQLMLTELPLPSLRPLLPGFLTGLVTLLGFALPPLLALKNVPPIRVLRRDLGPPPTSTWLIYSAAALALAALMLWQGRDARLVTYVMSGAVITLVVLSISAYALVRLLRPLRDRVGIAWRFGFANITRRPRASAVQIVAFGLGMMVLILLTLVRTDLLEGWRRSLPTDAPNHFLVNIQSDQRQKLHTFFTDHDLQTPVLYPMVRARLKAINDHTVDSNSFDNPRAQRIVTREFNLTWSEQLQKGNRVVAGRWWNPEDHGNGLISLEQEFAETLGIGIGDRLTYDIAGMETVLQVANFRTVEWDSFRVNFFAVVAPGVLDGRPATWVTSIHIASDNKAVLAKLVRAYPNITVVDVEALLQRLRGLIDRVATAVEYVFGFALAAGLAVLYAAIQSHQDVRRREAGVLRALGARRRQLLASLMAEFATLGSGAGLLAGLAAIAIAQVLAIQVFHFTLPINLWTPVIGALAGALSIGAAGIIGVRSVLNQPSIQVLRSI